jgi:hypothetical protein
MSKRDGLPKSDQTDRERILVNIAAHLAEELYSLCLFVPQAKEYYTSGRAMSPITVTGGFGSYPSQKPFKKGALVVCNTACRIHQDDPFLVSFVEANGIQHDPNGLVLRAIGTDKLCNYGNENFLEITGIPEKFLWEGPQWKFAKKLYKALRHMGREPKIDTYGHRYRGLEFVDDSSADVWVGEYFGGLGQKTKSYSIRVTFNGKTTINAIVEQLKAGGYGTRKFEPEDGKDEAPFRNPQSITRNDLISTLEASGIKLKDSVKNPPATT